MKLSFSLILMALLMHTALSDQVPTESGTTEIKDPLDLGKKAAELFNELAKQRLVAAQDMTQANIDTIKKSQETLENLYKQNMADAQTKVADFLNQMSEALHKNNNKNNSKN